MIRDRGNIKWSSMMLPEHVKLLKEYNKNLKKVEKPILDEQKYEEFNEIMARALNENLILTFTYYEKGEVKKLRGNIHSIDYLKREMKINDQLLKLENIIEIE